ncbi:MAG: TIGR03013 family PEP-CTERM/XrtA system glycosyltransferase [Pseudomonadales bacterium]|nr:TIGR03013 family PEP-CTERM/XrtA system glycosyltransferase [Pseudomonadales bacterium]
MIRLFNQYVRVPFLVLAALEFVIVILAVQLGTAIRFGLAGWQNISTPAISIVFVGAAVLVSIMSMGLYQSRLREGYEGVLARLGMSCGAAMLILSLIFYIFPSLYLGRGVLGIVFLLSFVGLSALRYCFLKVVDEKALKRRVLVLGAGKRAANIHKRIRRKADQRGFYILGYVHVHGERDDIPENRIINMDCPLNEYVVQNEVDEIVVAIDDRRQKFPLDELLDLKLNGVDVVDIMAFFEREMGKIETRMLYPGWLIFADGFDRSATRMLSKRVFDITASLMLLLVTWPVMLATMLAIRLEDGSSAPFLYKQTRVGLDGLPFDVLKFRSMIEDAEKEGAVWAQKNDMRVTKVGEFIRKYRIDELPQLINVLGGQMAFVGPRPERPEFIGDLCEKIPYFNERHRVKPGITGWAQLCYPYGASDEDSEQKLQYDLYYVKNHNLLLDLTILIQTVEVVLFGRGR